MYSDVNVKYEFQSSFELTGYITVVRMRYKKLVMLVSKLFRAYGLYNESLYAILGMGRMPVSKLFRAYGLYNMSPEDALKTLNEVSKLFRAYGLYNLCSLEGA